MKRDLSCHLRVIPIERQNEAIPCPQCQNPLDLSQPLLDRPEELLAACIGCGDWHVLLLFGDDQGTLTRLPVRELSASDPAPPARAGIRTSATMPLARPANAARR